MPRRDVDIDDCRRRVDIRTNLVIALLIIADFGLDLAPPSYSARNSRSQGSTPGITARVDPIGTPTCVIKAVAVLVLAGHDDAGFVRLFAGRHGRIDGHDQTVGPNGQFARSVSAIGAPTLPANDFGRRLS